MFILSNIVSLDQPLNILIPIWFYINLYDLVSISPIPKQALETHEVALK